MKSFAVLTTILATLLGWLWFAASARADYQAGCVSQPWRLGLQAVTRNICDGPLRADGSWKRARQFYAPAYMVGGSSRCYQYGSDYGVGVGGNVYGGFSTCSYSEPREVAEFNRTEVYIVTPATVLPDEPGHITQGQVA